MFYRTLHVKRTVQVSSPEWTRVIHRWSGKFSNQMRISHEVSGQRTTARCSTNGDAPVDNTDVTNKTQGGLLDAGCKTHASWAQPHGAVTDHA